MGRTWDGNAVGRLLDRLLAVTLTIVAVVLATVLVGREWVGDPQLPSSEPVYYTDWHDLESVGHRIGSDSARVTVIEFADFECPFCKRFASHMAGLREEYHDSLALIFVHYPLMDVHRFAEPAARAAECARDQGRFVALHDLLFEKQDSLGLKTWASYAAEAGVPDSVGFQNCIESTDPVPAVEAGLERGREVGVVGTPAVIIDGWFYPAGLNERTLRNAVAAVMRGEDP